MAAQKGAEEDDSLFPPPPKKVWAAAPLPDCSPVVAMLMVLE